MRRVLISWLVSFVLRRDPWRLARLDVAGVGTAVWVALILWRAFGPTGPGVTRGTWRVA